MSAWIGKTALVLGMVVLIAIRMPHERRSKETKIAESRKGGLEISLFVVMGIGGLVLPLMFIASPLLSFADYPLMQLPFCGGIVCLGISSWMLYRSHADLGTNWSVSLELRENHQLIVSGIYKRIRHPMYVSGLIFAMAQALLLPNWIAGPGSLVAMGLTVAFRVRPEERMMLERFGEPYRRYMESSKRFIPGIW